MSKLNTEQLARMIVGAIENVDLAEQKIQIVDGMLQNYLKLDVTNKSYQFKDLIEAISIINENYVSTSVPTYYRGDRSFYEFGLIDCATNNQLKYVKCFPHKNDKPPEYCSREEGIETLDDGRIVYFIRLRNLLSLTRFGKKVNSDENDIIYGNSISRELIELTIKTVNDYLKEHPLFVEQAILKRVRKP